MEFISANQDICQFIVQNEFQQIIAGGSDCPPVFRMQLHDQTVCLSSCFESPVMVGVIAAGVFDLMLIAV